MHQRCRRKREGGGAPSKPIRIATAAKLLLDTSDGIMKLRGRAYPYRDGVQIVPTLHPAAVLRGGGEAMSKMRSDLVRAKQILGAVAS